MNTALEELEIYNKNVRLAKSTLYTYSLYIKKFLNYLSEIMENDLQLVYLDKVSKLSDTNGRLIRYFPINGEIIDNYFSLTKHKGYNVLKDNYKALMSFFKFLEHNYNFSNPMYTLEFQLKDYLVEKKHFTVLTRGNILKLLNTIYDHSDNLERDANLFLTLISTGCRIGEILKLKCEDIDDTNDTLFLKKTKTNVERLLFLRIEMGETLKKYTINCNRKDTDFVFLSDDNKPFTNKEINTLLKRYLEIAKLPIMPVHGLRRTFATLMADQGTAIDIIRQLLGHESLTTTKQYINPHYVRNKDFDAPENKLILDYLNQKI
ncbi:tyrosine-type recombinase/integrase [Psychrobacillus psychrotolerans]|uniref:tyrosine-type recombinase/integrase n=1 Tax=Psychrobacillus psychrotolerans TaxID=126156 RepID=UPI003C7143FE